MVELMKFTKNKIAALLSLTLLGVYGCGSTPSSGDVEDGVEDVGGTVPDFESAAFFKKVKKDHAKAEVVTDQGVTNGSSALKVSFDSVSEANKFKYWPNVKVHPDSGFWNWNAKGSLSLDISNPTDSPANIILKLADNVGVMGSGDNQLNYAVNVPAGETVPVEMLFNGTKRKLDGYWGGEKINLRNIVEFQIFVQGPMDAQTVIIDNFDLVDATGDFIEASGQEVKVSGPIPTVASITSFDEGQPTFVAFDRSAAATVTELKTDMGGLLAVKLAASNAYPNITFKAPQPWDWSEHGDFSLAFDLESKTDEPLQLFVRVDDAENENWGGTANGVVDSMSSYVTLAPGDDGTFYLPLGQTGSQIVSGMRAEPPKKSYNAQAISYGWGEKSLDVSNIVSFQLYLQNPTKDAEFNIKSVRLIPNIDADATRYEGLIDQYGQFTGSDWPKKITEDEELETMGKLAKMSLKSTSQMPGRSIYGGWADGPKLKATGFFRTEKVDGKWALVDPQGNLFFATGVDNIRMDDTVTITGHDFADKDKRSGKEVASEVRRSMFTWLPEDDDVLAENYDYANWVHSGALKKGEVFSFYGANLQRKYGGTFSEAEKVWKDITVDRMVDWGFTTLGNWADPMFYDNQKVAYVANGWIFGDHARISTGNDYWGPIHDPFDPEFVNSVKAMTKKLMTEVDKNDPWMMGVFVDNEISWGNTKNDANHYGLVVNALSYNLKKSPAKKAFTEHLKEKYWAIEDLNTSWGVKVASWGEFEKSFDHRSRLSKNMKKDYAEMLEMLSAKYFSTVRAELKKVLPNHLYLGARFADWGVTPEIAKGAAPYVDVMSYNLYAEDLTSKGDWSKLAELDKPSIIGEFHFGATDSGLFHGGIVSAASQQDRAKKYTNYMNSIADNPYFVGAHWFQYIDSPTTGRAWDGENYNVGFVSITDTPYVPLVEAAKKFNQDVYKLRYKK